MKRHLLALLILFGANVSAFAATCSITVATNDYWKNQELQVSLCSYSGKSVACSPLGNFTPSSSQQSQTWQATCPAAGTTSAVLVVGDKPYYSFPISLSSEYPNATFTLGTTGTYPPYNPSTGGGGNWCYNNACSLPSTSTKH